MSYRQSYHNPVRKNFQRPINHIALVIDASYSMLPHRQAVIKVAESQIQYLARRSKELEQETRVSIYSFSDEVECLVFDTDVLRLPSIADLYVIQQRTALIAATLKSQADLAETAQRYGEHSFLTFVITDGEENASYHEDGGYRRRMSPDTLNACITGQADNWTVATLVPDIIAKKTAIQYGFPRDNVAIWDTTSQRGLEEAGEVIQAATETFLVGRASGVRGSRNLFSTGPEVLNKETVTATLTPLAMDKYSLIPVMPDGVQKGDKIRVDKFIREDCGMTFRLGSVYYEWSKKETVQPQKRLAVVQKSTGKVFVGSGDEVRELIGLPSLNTREAPKANPDYTVFVQSTAPNRNLVPFTKVLVMLP